MPSDPPLAAAPAIAVDTQGRRLALGANAVRLLAAFVLHHERARRAMLSITFLSRPAIVALNRRHLGHRGATDVITFALGQGAPGAPVVGDIYVAPDVVRAQARALGVPARQELARVVVHGVLHALGHAHPEGAGRERSPMWQRQERLLAAASRAGLL